MNLTLGETAEVERVSGQAIDAMNDPTAPKSTLLAALIMVIQKRTNPVFTLDDAFAMDADEAGKIIEAFFNTDPKD